MSKYWPEDWRWRYTVSCHSIIKAGDEEVTDNYGDSSGELLTKVVTRMSANRQAQ